MIHALKVSLSLYKMKEESGLSTYLSVHGVGVYC